MKNEGNDLFLKKTLGWTGKKKKEGGGSFFHGSCEVAHLKEISFHKRAKTSKAWVRKQKCGCPGTEEEVRGRSVHQHTQ